jgi:ATP-dependent Lon protease
MFSSGYGFVVDYLAEILRSLRNHDYSELYKAHFTLSPDISTRDRDGIHKTFSGLMKVLYPQGEASKAEIEELLQFSIEGRKRVKDQLMRIDTTYPKVKFAYTDNEGKSTTVQTLEEIEYPEFYYKGAVEEDIAGTPPSKAEEAAIEKKKGPEEKHLTFKENQKGVSYEKLFADYLEGAKQITITDPYIRLFYQTRNLMELLELIVRHKAADDEITVKLLTTEDEFKGDQQRESLDKIKDSCEATGIQFDWKFDSEGTIHARHIVTDNGWKISLDRGLDIFQPYEMNDTFTLANRLQEQRQCKGFEVTYIQAK